MCNLPQILTEDLVLLLVVRHLGEHVQGLADEALADHAEHLRALEDLATDVKRQVFRVHLFCHCRRPTVCQHTRTKKQGEERVV